MCASSQFPNSEPSLCPCMFVLMSVFDQLLVVRTGIPPPSFFLVYKFIVSGQSKAAWGHSRVESGVKLKKHTQWARRWGKTTRFEKESTRQTYAHAHTYKKLVHMHFPQTWGMPSLFHQIAFNTLFFLSEAAEGGLFVMYNSMFLQFGIDHEGNQHVFSPTHHRSDSYSFTHTRTSQTGEV